MGSLWCYSTVARYYLVSKKDSAWRILTLARRGELSESAELEAWQSPAPRDGEESYLTQQECSAVLRNLHAGNQGGLQLVCRAYGVIGCVRFLQQHYLLLISKRRYEGSLCGHKIYSIADTACIPLVQPSAQGSESMAEKRYRKLLLGMDLTQDFFFSYTYGIATTLQNNMTGTAPKDRFDSIFVWNSHLTKPLREALGNDTWVVPLIHGFWQQRSLAVLGRTLTMTLVARRSRHFAGTRYQKRGVNHEGRVANDVEVEQIVWAGLDRRHATPSLSSVVQVRGSIPLYWSQEGRSLRKPDILLQSFDPLYSATRAHFADLKQRYGSPLVCLDLVKAAEKHPREIVLRTEFDTAISYINQTLPPDEQIVHLPWDLNYHAKQQGSALLDNIVGLLDGCLDITGLFVHQAASNPQGAQLQQGVLRTNCIDCVDRTNVAQFAAGFAALGRQLQALGITDTPTIDARSSLARQLMDLYEAAGNTLARQYGGSEAHSTFFQRQRGDWEAATQSRDFVTSIKRFYNNAYTDAEKQAAINLVLGNFIPQAGRPALWDLDSDTYLHYTSGGSLKRTTSMPLRTLSEDMAPLESPRSASPPLPTASHPLGTSPSFGPYLNSWMDGHGGNGATDGPQPFSTPLSAPGTPNLRHSSRRSSVDGSASPGAVRLSKMLAEEAAAAAAIRRLATRRKAAAAAAAERQCVIAASQSAAAAEDKAAASELQPLSPGHDSNGSGDENAQPPVVPDAAFEDEQLHGSAAGPGRTAPADAAAAAGKAAQPLRGSSRDGGGARTPPAVDSPPRRRAKLESLDKLIGQQPDVVHHVRLHATPSQRAYLPQWLAAPLGSRRTSIGERPDDSAPAPAANGLPPIAEHSGGHRRTSADASGSTWGQADAPYTPVNGVRRTQSTDSGLQALVASAMQHQSPSKHADSPGPPHISTEEAALDLGSESPLFSGIRNGALPHAVAAPGPPSPPLTRRMTAPTALETDPELALTGPLRKPRSPGKTPDIGMLLSGGASDLGISPFLMAWWLSSDEHLAPAWFSAEKTLRKHYSRFIAETEAFERPAQLHSTMQNLCRVPSMPSMLA